jgi:ribose/xylose/arabinose/galactoside ABC-type transport system permease subunit
MSFYRNEVEMKRSIPNFLFQQRVLLVLLVLFVIASFSAQEFLTTNNLRNVLLQVATDGIIAVGMTFVLITGGIDLSVGSVVAMASVITIWMQPSFGSAGGILFAILAGAAVGMINALLVTQVGVSPFVSTLGTMAFVKGVALAIAESRTRSGIDPIFASMADHPVLGLPLATVIFLLLVLITNTYLVRSHQGRGFYAVGGNREASWLAGLGVNSYLMGAYILCSITAALGGVLITSRINTGSPIIGNDTVTIAVSAVLLGGTSMAGGTGNVVGTLLGVLIMGILKNMMNLMGVGGYYQTIILGALLVGMVLLDRYFMGRSSIVVKR